MDEKEKYQETFQTWNKVAELYQQHFMQLDLYNDSYDLFCALLPTESPRVLEIGCGPGNITQYLLARCPTANWLGIDIAPRMIELASINNPTAAFRVMDCRDIQQLTGKYDAIVAGFCIPYLSDRDCVALITHMKNCIQPGGVLYISFVAGNYDQSGFQTGSSGDRTYFYYHPLAFIEKELMSNQFEICHQLEKTFTRKSGQSEIHTILIAKCCK